MAEKIWCGDWSSSMYNYGFAHGTIQVKLPSENLETKIKEGIVLYGIFSYKGLYRYNQTVYLQFERTENYTEYVVYKVVDNSEEGGDSFNNMPLILELESITANKITGKYHLMTPKDVGVFTITRTDLTEFKKTDNCTIC